MILSQYQFDYEATECINVVEIQLIAHIECRTIDIKNSTLKRKDCEMKIEINFPNHVNQYIAAFAGN